MSNKDLKIIFTEFFNSLEKLQQHHVIYIQRQDDSEDVENYVVRFTREFTFFMSKTSTGMSDMPVEHYSSTYWICQLRFTKEPFRLLTFNVYSDIRGRTDRSFVRFTLCAAHGCIIETLGRLNILEMKRVTDEMISLFAVMRLTFQYHQGVICKDYAHDSYKTVFERRTGETYHGRNTIKDFPEMAKFCT